MSPYQRSRWNNKVREYNSNRLWPKLPRSLPSRQVLTLRFRHFLRSCLQSHLLHLSRMMFQFVNLLLKLYIFMLFFIQPDLKGTHLFLQHKNFRGQKCFSWTSQTFHHFSCIKKYTTQNLIWTKVSKASMEPKNRLYWWFLMVQNYTRGLSKSVIWSTKERSD